MSDEEVQGLREDIQKLTALIDERTSEAYLTEKVGRRVAEIIAEAIIPAGDLG